MFFRRKPSKRMGSSRSRALSRAVLETLEARQMLSITPVITTLDDAVMAGAGVHVRATDSLLDGNAPQSLTYAWDFGDLDGQGTPAPHNQMRGFNAAHVYDTPGTYTISLTITDAQGISASSTDTVTIAADTRTVLTLDSQSALDALTSVSANTRVQFVGAAFTLDHTVSLGANVLLTSANVDGSRTRLNAAGGSDDSLHVSGDDVTIENLSFDTPSAASTLGRSGVADVVELSNGRKNLVLRDNEFLNVGSAINGNSGPQGVLMQDNAAPSVSGLRGNFAWVQGSDWTFTGNSVANSTRQTLVVVEGGVRLNFSDNDLANLQRHSVDSGDDAMGSVGLTDAVYVYAGDNAIGGSSTALQSQGSSDGVSATNSQYVVVEYNAIDNTSLQVRAGTADSAFRDNTLSFSADTSAAFDVNGGYQAGVGLTVTNVAITHNTILANGHNLRGIYLHAVPTNLTIEGNLFDAAGLNFGYNGNSGMQLEVSDLTGITAGDNGWVMPAYLYEGGYHQLDGNWVSPTSWTNLVPTDGFYATATAAAIAGAGVRPIFTPGEPPATPPGLSATAAVGQVALIWPAVTGAVSYNLYRSTTAGGEGSTPYQSGLTSTSYSDTGLAGGTTYYYKVSAVNADGESGLSAEASAMTPVVSPYGSGPLLIEGGQATTLEVENFDLGNANVVYHDSDTSNQGGSGYRPGTQVDISDGGSLSNGHAIGWTAAGEWLGYTIEVERSGTYDLSLRGSSPLSGKTIHLEFGPVGQVGGAGVSSSSTFTVTNTGDWNNYQSMALGQVHLDAGTQWVRLVEETGGYNLDKLTFTLLSPAAPTGLSATAGDGQVSLTWDADEDADSYNVYRGTSSNGEGATPLATGVTTASFTDSTATNGTAYYYKISAVNGAGEGGLSYEESATPQANALDAPSNLAISGDSRIDSVNLNWTDNSTDEDGFIIERKTGSSGSWVQIGSVAANTTTYSDKTVREGTAYSYRISATNVEGTSTPTSELPTVTLLEAPTNFTVTAISTTSYLLRWLDNSTAESGYVIERTLDGTNWTTVATPGANTSSYTDSTLSSGDNPEYGLHAANEDATSAEVTSSDPMPDKPSLTGTQGITDPEHILDLTYSTADGSNLELEWINPAVDDNFHTYATGLDSSAGGHIVSVSGLSSGTEYQFRLRAERHGDVVYATANATTASDAPDDDDDPALTPLPTPEIESIDPGTSMAVLGIKWDYSSVLASTTVPDEGAWPYFSFEFRYTRTDDPYHILNANDGGVIPYYDDEGPTDPLQWGFFGASPGVSYHVQARATVFTLDPGETDLDDLFGPSAWSPSHDFIQGGPRLPVLNLTSTPASAGYVTLSWDTPTMPPDYDPAELGVVFFIIDPSTMSASSVGLGAANSTVVVSDGSVTLPALPSGQKYMAVTATIGDAFNFHYGAYSNKVSGEGLPYVAAPDNLVAYEVNNGDKGSVRLVWDNVPNNEESYTIQRSVDGGDTYTTIGTTDADKPYFTDTSKQLLGMTYKYRVYASNADTDSDFSNIASVSIPRVCAICLGAVGPAGSAQQDLPSIYPDAFPFFSQGGSTGSSGSDDQSPYLIRLSGTNNNSLSVVYGNGQQTYFDWNGTAYIEDFGGTDTLVHNGSGFVLTDASGQEITFPDSFANAAGAPQSLMEMIGDPGGNRAHVISHNTNGDPTEIRITNSLDQDLESWLYAYISGGDSDGKLQTVTQRIAGGSGNWVPTRIMTYTYYDGTTSDGNSGDLKSLVISDGLGGAISTKYFRYYTPGESDGFTHALKYSFGDDSLARVKAAYATNDIDSLTDAQIDAYSDAFYEYDKQQKVALRRLQGEGCSTCTGGQGTYSYNYIASGNADGYNSWSDKVIETLPDGNQNITYYNFAGQVMLAVSKDMTTGQTWGTFHEYDSDGREILTANPSAVALPGSLTTIEAYDDLLNNTGGDYEYLSDSDGLISLTDYYSSTTATSTVAGGAAGFVQDTKIKHGEMGTAILQSSTDYFAHSGTNATIFVTADSTVYSEEGGSGAQTTSYAYTWFTGVNQMQSQTVTAPVISTAQNGPGTADVQTYVYDRFGRPIWHKDADGFIDYTQYDVKTGGVIKTITDVDTTQTSDFDTATLPSGWSTPTGGGLHRVSTMQVDELGRTTRLTDPNGNVTYTVYDDVNHETRTYRGWDATTGTTTGPTEVQREDLAGSYIETLTMNAAPAVSGSSGSYVPTGAETISGVLTLSRTYSNIGGQVTASDAYFNLSGVTYSTAANLGTEGTHYDRTEYSYDDRGRLKRTINPNGTITRTLYDGLGRTISTWIGTDDTPTSGYWSPENTDGTNLIEVSSNEYDNGGVGDGNLTKMTQFVSDPNATGHDASTDRVTEMYYDWRDRLVASKSGVQSSESTSDNTHPITYQTLNNLGQVTTTASYDGDNVSLTDADSDGVPDAPSSALRRSYSVNFYDDQGRLYGTDTYAVDPADGTTSAASLSSRMWYDHRGNVIKSVDPSGLVTKSQYDGAGRMTKTFSTDGGGDSSWADASTVTGDIVVAQMQTQYDDNGNPIFSIRKDRLPDASGTGELDGTTGRISYGARYYDAANRLTASVDVGTNGGSAYSRPSTVPTRSDSVLVTSYGYNDSGWVQTVTDPKGIVARTEYDTLGRTVKTIAAYTDGTPTDATNQITTYTYDGNGNVLTMTAALPGSEHQTTQYVYGASQSRGDAIDSNDLLIATRYPDKSSGDASSSEEESYTVNALGERTSYTDRNGSTHAYSHDVLGRLTLDAVTTLGSGVDGSVRALGYTYNTQGLVEKITSYSDAAATTVVNQVQRTYNGLGQLTGEYQEHSGAVNTSTTPKVQYAFSTLDDGSRPTSRTYPNGRVLHYVYTSGLDDTIGRLSYIANDNGSGGIGTHLEEYAYLGFSILNRLHPESGVDLNVTLDDFGRVVTQDWNDGTNSLDKYTYTYDRNSNRLTKANTLHSALDEAYTYDNLNRLTATTRNGSAYQSWDLDATGNWEGFTDQGTTDNRTHNLQNQVTAAQGNTLAFDANGNMTTDENGNQLIYDAWNHLVKVKDSSGTSLQTYVYDALGRRIKEGSTDLYLSPQDQVLEERNGSSVTTQNVFSPAYVDALIERDRDTDANGTLDERIYVLQDANWNETALASTNGTILQRYAEASYGNQTVLTSAWAATTDAYGFLYGHQGGRFDPATGLYHFRARDYSPTLGRWIQADAAGYVDGASLYQYELSSPIDNTDSMGLDSRDPAYDYSGDLTREQSRQLKSAIGFWLTDAGVGNALFMWGDSDRSLTLSFLRRYLNGGGDQTLPYSTISGTSQIQEANKRAAAAICTKASFETGVAFQGDLGTSLGRVWIKYTFSNKKTIDDHAGHCTCQATVKAQIYDHYTFAANGPEEAHVNVVFPGPSLNFEGWLAGWKGGSNIPDRWMKNLEDFGYAKSFHTTINWTFKAEHKMERK